MDRKALSLSVTMSLGILASAGMAAYAQGRQEAITVHGHWLIEVRNPDGTLAAHRSIENGLIGGGRALGMILSRRSATGEWTVLLMSPIQGLPSPFGTTGVAGILTESTGPMNLSGAHVFRNLTLTAEDTGLVLKGSATAVKHGFITSVQTWLTGCHGTATPASCVGESGVQNQNSGVVFSGTALAAPLEVQPEQIVQVKVTISFSSPTAPS